MDQITALRDLTEDETSQLRKLLKSELPIISSVDDDEDADNLLEYAMDMIEGGENVEHVVEELKFMELPVCDEGAANKMGVCLMRFFAELELGIGGKAETPEMAHEEHPAPVQTEGQSDKAKLEEQPATPPPEPEPPVAGRTVEPSPPPPRAEPAPEPLSPVKAIEPSPPPPRAIREENGKVEALPESKPPVPVPAKERSKGAAPMPHPAPAKTIAPLTPPRAQDPATTGTIAPSSPPRARGSPAARKQNAASPADDESRKMTPMELRELEKRRERERKEAEKLERARGIAPLKQRLAAFRGASSERSLPDHGRAGESNASPKASGGTEKEGKISNKVNAASSGSGKTPRQELEQKEPEKKEPAKKEQKQKQVPNRAGLKQRLAAYQGASSRNTEEAPKNGTGKRKSVVLPKVHAAPPEPTPHNDPERKEREKEREKERGPAPKRTSLKQRLAAYQSASSRKLEQEQEKSDESDESAKDDVGAAKESPDPPKVEEAPGLSLKERMAAFQGGAASFEREEEQEEEAPPEEDDNGIDDTPICLRDRLAAFQRAEPSIEREEEQEEEAPPEEDDDDGIDDTPISLKDRLAAFQRAEPTPAASAEEEEEKDPKVKSRASASKPSDKNRSSLRDRMAVFGQAKSAPNLGAKKEKEMTAVQQRMAVFSKKGADSSEAVAAGEKRAKNGTPGRVHLPGGGGGGGGSGGLKDRLAKYAETAGAAETDAFVAPKKKSVAKAKRKSFAPKKPKGDLHLRMQKFQSSGGAETDRKEGPPEEAGDEKEQKKWKYQTKGEKAAPAADPKGPKRWKYRQNGTVKTAESNKKTPPAEAIPKEGAGKDANLGQSKTAVASERPAVDLKTRLSVYQANAVSPHNVSTPRKEAVVPAADLKGRMSTFQASDGAEPADGGRAAGNDGRGPGSAPADATPSEGIPEDDPEDDASREKEIEAEDRGKNLDSQDDEPLEDGDFQKKDGEAGDRARNLDSQDDKPTMPEFSSREDSLEEKAIAAANCSPGPVSEPGDDSQGGTGAPAEVATASQ